MPGYQPAWWLPGPHLQTLWGPLVRRPRPVVTHVERWRLPDGDTVALERLTGRAGAPRLLILHGLEGSSRSPYVRGLLGGAHALEWNADVLNFRGCGGEPNTVRRFYHSGETGDLTEVLARLRMEDPDSPVGIAGFSLGGNVLLKWLGEQGSATGAVRAAAAVSVPYDLERGARHIHAGFSRLYERRFLRTLKRKALAKRAHFPDLPPAGDIETIASLVDFDDLLTAPVHGFRDAVHYYAASSALGWLRHVRAPTLLLSARDDPFLPESVLPQVADEVRANPALRLEIVERGGHVGFVEGRVPWRAGYYAERRVLEFLAGQLEGRASPAHHMSSRTNGEQHAS